MKHRSPSPLPAVYILGDPRGRLLLTISRETGLLGEEGLLTADPETWSLSDHGFPLPHVTSVGRTASPDTG